MTRRRAAELLLVAGLCAHAFFLSISIAGMQLALGAVAIALLVKTADGFRPRRTPLDLPLAVFVAVLIASDLLSRYGPVPLVSATLWRACAGFWLVAQGVAIADDPARRGLQLLGAALAGLCLASVVGLLQYSSGFDPLYLLHLRNVPVQVPAPGVDGRYAAVGFFISRLTFANGAAVLVSLASGVLLGGGLSGKSQKAALGAVALGLAAILATFDRAAWLGLFAAAAVAVLCAGQRSGRLRAIFLGAVLLAASAGALHPGVRQRFQSGFSVQGNGDRVFLWSRALEVIRDHPLLGVGFANYRKAAAPYYDRVDPAFPMRTWAHNTELSLLAETGPLGVLALLWLAASAARALWRRARDLSASATVQGRSLALGALAAGAAIAVIGQVHDVLYDTKVMYPVWFALALGLAGGSALWQKPRFEKEERK